MIKKDELLFVVDENNLPLAPKSRKEVHSKGIWHRSSHIWVVNSQNQILCQKRSNLKDKFPGFWEPYFGGNLEPGEDYLTGAVREGNEELNFGIKKRDLKFFKIFKSEIAREFISVYFFRLKGQIGKITFEKSEVDRIKWFDFSKLKEIFIRRNKEWVDVGYNLEALMWLETSFLKK